MDIEPSGLGDLQNYRSVQALKIVQVFNTLGTFLFPALFNRRFKQTEPLFTLTQKGFNFISFVLVAAVMCLLLPFVGMMAAWNESITLPHFLSEIESLLRKTEVHAQAVTNAFLDMHSFSELAINILVIAALAAFCEEFFFRGALQSLFLKTFRNPHSAIWCTAAVFSAFHLQFFGFFPRLFLGALLGYFTFWSGNIWYSIFGHFVNNAVTVLVYYLILRGAIHPSWENLGTRPQDVVLVLVGIILGISTLWIVRRSLVKRRKLNEARDNPKADGVWNG